MNAMKSVLLLVMLIAVFTLFIVPVDAGLFPAWLDTDLVGFMLVVLTVVFALVLVR